jgi:ribosomal protein L37E
MKEFIDPQETLNTEMSEIKMRADLRRLALKDLGYSTYQIGKRNNGDSIICLCCGLGSVDPLDVHNAYCAFCRQFHSEWTAEINPINSATEAES